MEFLKNTAQLVWEEAVKAAAVLLVGMLLPFVFDRAKAAWGVVGGRIADFGWWMRGSVSAA